MLSLGQRLKMARKRRGLSQREAGRLAGVGEKSLSRYETGRSDPSPAVLSRLARLYDVSGEFLLGNTQELGSTKELPDLVQGEDLVTMSDYRELAKRLIGFISGSPSKFHAIYQIALMLENRGYIRLDESGEWELSPGGSYYVTRNQSSLIAFRIPREGPAGFNIIAAHCDSPTYRIKPEPEIASPGGLIKINTERYGGMIPSSWLDRPLSAAGRLTVLSGGGLTSRLVNIDRDLMVIPSVAIHMQRGQESPALNPQVDMLPIIGGEDAKGSLLRLAAESAGVGEKDILSSELYLYQRQRGCLIGTNDELILSPQLDDLQGVYSSLRGFIAAEESESAPVLAVFDNEEVGSSTRQGAASDFLELTLKRIADAAKKPYAALLASSFVISTDNAHAVHPNHPELADPVVRPRINGGIVIKQNGNQRYATDAVSEGVMRLICRRAGVPVQTYVNRSDIPGGSTLGNILASRVSVKTVDIGLAQLAMHSSFETAGACDSLYLARAAAEFYRTKIVCGRDGEIALG